MGTGAGDVPGHRGQLNLAPALLGAGTIFQAKVRADDHWSTSPKIAMVCEVDSGTSGAPGPPD
ncbi:MAG TPA: hypothetical protein VND44_06620 [Acidimicrobiales bacterium]|nr:hypothetical protein [Acidimicrobiales bacterium]